ncbi:MAG: hypothetical protein RLZZ262_1699, partial [Bacteroidota bacterium]|jgi:hypothetical protein
MMVYSDLQLMDLDQNGQQEYWRFWISNGQLIHWVGYTLSDQGKQVLEGATFKNLLLQKKEVQDMVALSQKGYAGFSRYKTSDFEKRPNPAPLTSPSAETQEQKTPFVSITSSLWGPLSFFEPEAAEQLKAQCKLPADFKKTGQPIMVAFEVTINAENRITQLIPLSNDPKLSALYAEAKRLAALLPGVRLPPPGDREFNGQLSRTPQKNTYTLLFYFAP